MSFKNPCMKNNLLLISAIYFLISANLHAQNKSLLWEITGNGLSKPSYIYGTIHVSDKIAFHLTDSFFIALKSADIIALESNPETWIENDYGNSDAAYENYSNDYYGDYYDSEDFYTEATSITIPNVKTYNMAFADNSWLINGYLYRYNDYHGDYEEDTYLDLFIFQSGKKLNKKIEALEGEQEVLKLLQKAYEPNKNEEENSEYIEQRSLMDELYEDGTSIYDQINEAYRNGDLEKLDSLERITAPSKQYHKYFIEERNINMMQRLDSIMKTGKNVFTGIGATHLPGESGALNLLRAKGYTVKPVKGKITGKSIKEKDKIDATYFPHNAFQQFASDSIFNLSVPGKLYNIPTDQVDEFYLFPDMANSAYYTIIRINHHAAFKSEKSEDIKREIDKILFENIPGDIVFRADIKSNNGIPGFDIISKPKRGNMIRFNIFITPLETIIFKVGGIGDFVIRSKEAQTFFSSIQFKTFDNNQWSNYSPEWGLFDLKIPVTRIVKEVKAENYTTASQTIAKGEAIDNKGFYWYTCYYLNDDAFIEEDSFELVRFTDMFYQQFKKQNFEKKNQQFSNVNGCPGIETTLEGNNEFLYTKVVIKGPYYILIAALKNKDEYPSEYFDSFQFKDLNYSKIFETYTDTFMLFTVSTIPPIVDTLLSFEEIEYGLTDYDYEYGINDEVKDISYLGDTKTMIFSSQATPENIFIKFHQYHKFYSTEDKNNFWSTIEENMAMVSGMKLTRKIFIDEDSIQRMDFLLTDTASTRGILRKIILKDNVIYYLSTCIDTITTPSKFITEFYTSFYPSDSVNGRSIFESPGQMLFSQLNSEDSVLRKQAINSVKMVNLINEGADSIIRFINTAGFKKLKFEEREEFIYALSQLENKNVVPALKRIYLEAGDTSSLQLAALKGLALQKSDQALKVFSELLYFETPLASKGSSLSWVFTPFSDTLELASKLFPQLYDFIALPEYQYSTYRLLALISKNDIKKNTLYTKQKKQIIAEATAELKRNLAGKEEKEIYTYNSYSNKVYFPKLMDITGGRNYSLYENYGDYSYSDYNYDYYNNYNSYNNDEIFNNYYSKKKDYTWATTLLDYYSILLTAFYDDAIVKKYYDKIFLSNDDGLIYRTSLTLLANKLPVPDSVWTNLLKNREWRYFTVKQLQKLEKTDKIDTSLITQLKIAEGCLYQYEFKDKEDSVVFITKKLVITKEKEGYIYIFKSKIGKDKAWNLDCIGIQPVDQTKFEIEPMFVNYGDVILDEDDLNEQIGEIVKNIEMVGRSRVRISAGGNAYDYDYDEY